MLQVCQPRLGRTPPPLPWPTGGKRGWVDRLPSGPSALRDGTLSRQAPDQQLILRKGRASIANRHQVSSVICLTENMEGIKSDRYTAIADSADPAEPLPSEGAATLLGDGARKSGLIVWVSLGVTRCGGTDPGSGQGPGTAGPCAIGIDTTCFSGQRRSDGAVGDSSVGCAAEADEQVAPLWQLFHIRATCYRGPIGKTAVAGPDQGRSRKVSTSGFRPISPYPREWARGRLPGIAMPREVASFVRALPNQVGSSFRRNSRPRREERIWVQAGCPSPCRRRRQLFETTRAGRASNPRRRHARPAMRAVTSRVLEGR